ncbi:integrase catalytic domain-containing protein [Trichonephila clavata]|uniref:Integrase catalytic domain-containing protein n=1 Tax=Trichonephila clavata TaxID=2740835 RepID=A0A8X6F083_TRICU|nr:integrase catalytic domain-containing protein [Trichonephila clavata]
MDRNGDKGVQTNIQLSENCEISLLIGSDFYWSLTHRIKRLDSSLVAVETSLGWSLHGKCDERSDCTSVHLIQSEEESISAELRRFWEIESLGIHDKDSVTLGNGDEKILSEFDKSVCFVNGRYRYKDVINNYVREGIVERTSWDSLSDSQGFYLPHHAVIRSDKTTSRLRVVFDGSAHEDGHLLLNQSLYTGPNLHPNMLELLLRFRKNPVAFTADVKSAFLQIELDLRDRDFTSFFWTDNLNNNPYVLNFTRVLFGLRPCPYLLAATLKHHFRKYKKQYPHTFDLPNSSIYVDDFICGRNDVLDALRTTLECLQIFSDAGMLLRKWRTNSKQLDLLWQKEAFKPYIKNRVQEIQLLSDTCQWGHCPGKDNPADLISRGTSAVKLAQNELWWHGSPWLKLTPDHWPNRHRVFLDSELCSEEVEYRSSVHLAVTQQRDSLVDINRFSSLKKLLKVTAWVFRFVNNARNVNKSMDFYITADEIQNAEYFWLKYVQYEFYSAEILAL